MMVIPEGDVVVKGVRVTISWDEMLNRLNTLKSLVFDKAEGKKWGC